MPHINTGFLGALASCVLLSLASSPAAAQSVPLKIESPQPTPDVTFTDEMSESHNLREIRAKLTAVHFWASWCTPCIAELPEVDAAAGAYAAQGFKVIAISLDDNMSKAENFMKLHNIVNITPFLDHNTAGFQATKSPGLPTTIFLDSKGHEIARAEGPLDWDSQPVRDFITSHLK